METTKIRTLELFSGSKSFTKGVIRKYHDAECITLDNVKNFNPTHCYDILEFDYK